MNKYHVLTGMKDLLPEETSKWQYVENIIYLWIQSYAYAQIRTPILEPTHLFVRSVGEDTDIVGKEMYSFQDVSGESVSLRPEGTVSTLRAIVQNNYLYSGPKKIWYYGPMFRRERPQKGRYRQFHQFGVEVLGFAGPDVDAEILLMCFDLWKRLGIHHHVQLQINTLGNTIERQAYKRELIQYFKEHETFLDEDSRRRLKTNPLRILDSKNPKMQELCNHAPQLYDFLGQESKDFYHNFKDILVKLAIPFQENFRLVRGLDYYNHTVFEWVTHELGSQGTICAGGRYNGLTLELGGHDVEAIGFAMGMERIILLLEMLNQIKIDSVIDFFVVSQNVDCLIQGMKYATILRMHHYSVYTFLGGKKMSFQFKKADASGAKYAMIIGETELLNHMVTFKDLRQPREQQTIASEKMLDFLKEWIR